MIEVRIPKDLEMELSEINIRKIIEKSFGRSCDIKYNYIKIKEKRKIGKYIILESNSEVKFILLSRLKEDGRNAYLIQRVPPVYKDYLSYKTYKKKYLECYLFEENGKILSPYQLFIIKLLLTLDFKILNFNDVRFNYSKLIKLDKTVINLDFYSKFNSFKEIRNFRYYLSEKNSSNISTTFEMIDNKINVYGKTYGANGMETVIISLVLRKILSDIEIDVYEMDEKSGKYKVSTSENNKKILESFKINLIEDRMPLLKKEISEIAKRNQRQFHINLLNKYKDKKCFLCDCEIENLIIASHIHRVTDILNDDTLDEKTKNFQIIDADNGIWLCANHDKLFENGFIKFLGNKIFLNCEKSLEYKDKKYIRDITKDNEYIKLSKDKDFYYDDTLCYLKNNNYINENTKKYLEKHLKRFSPI